MKTQLCVLIPIPAFVGILMSVFGQGSRSFWIFRHLPSTKWQQSRECRAPGTQVLSQFSWAGGGGGAHIPVYPGTSPYTAPAASCYPIYELQIMFFLWIREASASAHVHACSRPEFFTALVYRRVDNTAFLCPHGSFVFSLISSAGLNEGIGCMLGVDQYLPIYLYFCGYLHMVYMWAQPHTCDDV